jgi:hypothetical protein
MMAKLNYYILVSRKGVPITTDHKLPIYWRYDIAEQDAVLFKAFIKIINIEKLKSIIED